ncbi:MAG: hypothetical protein Q4F99_02345 [bacterium]|nr:hypothetical protein [bacterium]
MAYHFLYSSMARTIQVRLMKGADIDALATLDQKYWLMLSCPVQGLGDGETIGRLLDTDNDNRVRIPDVLATIDWLRPRLNGFDCLFTPTTGLSATDICTTTPEGEALAKVFQRLASEGILTAAAMDGAIATFRAQVDNGDGVVPATAAGEKWTALGEAILAVTGGAVAVDGSKGITKEILEAFLKARAAYEAWKTAAPQTTDFPDAIDPATAAAAVNAIAAKVEAFFLACDMVRYNPAAKATFEAPTDLAQLATAPICLPSAEAYTLPFERGINPTDSANMAVVAMLAKALDPDADALDSALWSRVKAAVEPFAKWAAGKPEGADVFAAMDEAMWTSTADVKAHEAFLKAIETDAAQMPLAAAFDDLRRLVILRVDFLRLLRNFVNVEDLYPPTARALFQVGTLYMDGRSCTLCFPVAQAAAAHAAAAKDSSCCLAYCTLSRPSEKKTQTICAVFTAGSAATLAVGRNGLFYDLKGVAWEATITHFVPASMGLLEAFFAPWRKMAEAFKSVITKFISSKNDVAMTAMTTKAETAATTATTGKAAPPAPAAKDPSASMASIATLGIALSFFATAVTGIVAALTNTPLWKILLAVLGCIGMISLPNVLLTWFKLRARNLASILNASGWAVNRRIGLTPPLGRYFTQETIYIGKRFVPAKLPKGSKRNKIIALLVALLVIVAAVWYFWCPTSPRQKAAAAEQARTEAKAKADAAAKAAAQKACIEAAVKATAETTPPVDASPAPTVAPPTPEVK